MKIDWNILWNCVKYGHWKILWQMIKFEWRWRKYKSPLKKREK